MQAVPYGVTWSHQAVRAPGGNGQEQVEAHGRRERVHTWPRSTEAKEVPVLQVNPRAYKHPSVVEGPPNTSVWARLGSNCCKEFCDEMERISRF